MLSDDQTEAIVNCIRTGGGTEFDWEGVPLCGVLDAIIDHLESQRLERSLFGLVDVHPEPEPGEFSEATPEEMQRMFVHHTMHWAFQLGVGAALIAVGMDRAAEKKETPGDRLT